MTVCNRQMWLSSDGEISGLRQGDLVKEIRVPKFALPPWIVMMEGSTNLDRAKLQIESRLAFCLVVSQCCTLERAEKDGSSSSVSLAPIRPVSLRLEEAAYFKQADVADSKIEQYPTDFHAIRAIEGLVEPPKAGLIMGADLSRTFPVSGQWSTALAEGFCARMTVEARHHLRDRLMIFWGRTPEEDRMPGDP